SLKFTGMQEVKKEELVIGSLVDEAISLLQNSISENNVIISKEIHDSAKCFGNRILLITVFSNLIKNSIEAGANHITLTAHKKGNNYQINFIDDGKGIEIKQINRIFEPFYTKKNQTGLGLYLAKKIIDIHEGEIKVFINSNTIFTIILKA
ncbi:ATP-binding protein, partial [candidate division WOR-3 bacterium]|nr:ATP-binding protein [candidate division WOR-3 bacterium]